MPIVLGEQEAVRATAFSECMAAWQLIQSADWKYVRHLAQAPDALPVESLYHIKDDPDELHDRSEDPACVGVLAELRQTRDRLLDATPPAQLGWASFGAMDDSR